MKILLFMLVMVLILGVVYRALGFILKAIFGEFLGRLIAIALFIILLYLIFQQYHPYFE